MFRYLVRISKEGPAAHVWTGNDTACRMWTTGGLKPNGVRLAETQMGHRLCRICVADSGVSDDPGLPVADTNAALASLPVPPGCGWKAKPKKPTKRELKAQKAAALAAKLARPQPTHVPIRKGGLSYAEANSDDFLSSYAWRSLRWKVITHYGARCMCCGASPETGAVMHVDHIKPRRKRPDLALDFDNLQVLCEACNHGKGNTEADFRPAEVDPEVSAMLRSIARHG